MSERHVLVNLADVSDDHFEIVDDKCSYHYQRVYSPDNKKLPNWTVFIKPTNAKQEKEWKLITSGILTDTYTVASTDGIVQSILSTLNSVPIYKNSFSDVYGFTTCTFSVGDMKLNLPIDDPASREIFKFITGVDSGIEGVTCESSLSFTITNSMIGRGNLILNYGLMHGYNQRSLKINNIYLFPDFEIPLIHDKQLSFNFDNTAKVKEIFESRVKLFQSIPVGDGFVEDLKRHFPIRLFNSVILTAWNKFDAGMKNLYYLTFLLSYSFGKVARVDAPRASKAIIRNMVDKYVRSLQKAA